MISKNTARLYLQSEKGKAMTELFTVTDDADLKYARLEAIYDLCADNILQGKPLEKFMAFLDAVELSIKDTLNTYSLWDCDYTCCLYGELIRFFQLYGFDNDGEDIDKNNIKIKAEDLRNKITLIPYISLSLYYIFLEGGLDYFYPILFNNNFQTFRKWCALLGIEMPDIPPQKDYEGRIVFYLNLCENIEMFRKDLDLSQPETCALLYGYANDEVTEELEKIVIPAELPAPTRIWLTGASKGDYKDTLNTDSTHGLWACNENTKRGDIVIIYALAPYSCIHSIWRAEVDGNINPFDYFCNRIEVCQKIVVPPITFNELMEDEYMNNVPIVRSHLMGINGKELTNEDYKNLQRMMADKGFDISILPQIEAPDFDNEIQTSDEAEVSEKLLIPLLSELGYSAEDGVDWKRELQLNLGRDRCGNILGIFARPDFTFFYQDKGHRQKVAPFLIECKFDMRSNNERESAFDQAVSYANHLHSKMMGICDRNILRIYKTSRDYFDMERDLAFDRSWQEIRQPEVFNALKKLIGKDEVLRMIHGFND